MGTQTCRGTPTVIEDEEDAPTLTVAAIPVLLILVLVVVPGKAMATVLAVVLELAMILVLVLVLVKSEEAGVRDVAVTDFFFFLGGAPPLRPLPLGIPVNTKFVIFGRFLALRTSQQILSACRQSRQLQHYESKY